MLFRTFLLFFFVFPADDFLCVIFVVKFLTIADVAFISEIACNSSKATLTKG